jgi:glutamine amidotransferase PdxT
MSAAKKYRKATRREALKALAIQGGERTALVRIAKSQGVSVGSLRLMMKKIKKENEDGSHIQTKV